MNAVQQNLRQEIKCVVDGLSGHSFETWVKTQLAGFNSVYPDRIINNMYFDTVDLRCFTDNLAGISKRTKCRLRWYGDNKESKQAVLEFKLKHNRLGKKESYNISFKKPFLETKFSELCNEIRKQLPPEASILFSNINNPILINRYSRSYYAANDGMARITVDGGLVTYDQRFGLRPNLKHKANTPNFTILECKFLSVESGSVKSLVSSLPHRVTKSSKYAIGVQAILGY